MKTGSKIFSTFRSRFLVDSLKKGGVGVIPTDTIYGIVARALSPLAVEKVYALRRRSPDKPSIILIGSLADLDRFSIRISKKEKQMLGEVWPGPVSVILPCSSKKFSYLHRGTKTLAFRLPNDHTIVGFLKKTGPLIAPSANMEGSPAGTTIREARRYFGKSVDFYVDTGKRTGAPSRLIQIQDDAIITVRA